MVINAIRWIQKTGAPWRDLPEYFGPWETIYSRFRRWREQGIWQGILDALKQAADAIGNINWDIHFLDGTTIRAHQHSAGARKGENQALGYSRGGFGTKIHLRVEGFGKPFHIISTAGQVHEMTQAVELMRSGAVKRIGHGRPKVRPRHVAGDKGYSYDSFRTWLKKRGITPVIPRKINQKQSRFFDRKRYRMRNLIERVINYLKQNRRLATRYEKLSVNFDAMWIIASIFIWL